MGSVREDRAGVVVHEAPRTGGIGGEIVALIQEQCPLRTCRRRCQRVTGWDTVFPLKRAEHHYLPTVERIVAAARRTLEG